MCQIIVEPRRRDTGEIYRVIKADAFRHPHVEWIACGTWLGAEGMPLDMVSVLVFERGETG